MKNRTTNISSLKQIAALLKNANSVLIFPHMQMDGDTLGSSVALCSALRKQGKKADVLIEDEIPGNLRFLDKGYCTSEFHGTEVDVCIALDCSDWMRLEKRQDAFKRGKHTALLDHHTTSQPFTEYWYVDTEASSTGEILFLLLKEMEVVLDTEIAEAIYTAILTDTGSFLYSNTSAATHMTVAELFKTGMDHNIIAVEIYQRKRIEKVKLFNAILSTMEPIREGKANLAVMTSQMLKETGAFPAETEGLVEELRNIDGVEISAFLREEEGRVRVTMRAKTNADVSKIATKFGGGGHTKAAGCTIPGTIEEVKPLIVEAIIEQLDSLEGR
ncbi:MAG: DHH family phosphoesterase [Anaerovoracaceae bacterium]|jgi:phosphoesterase RecJ-like protein